LILKVNEGDLIRAPFFEGVGQVTKFEPKSGYYVLELILLNNDDQYKSIRLPEEQVNQITVLSEDLEFYHDSKDFFLLIEALRIRLAYLFDPLLAVNISQVDPLPHQIEGVYSYALANPKVRFLIADDAGAGKTVMAGLIIKELQYRNLANRILIVVPGHLKYQWQREMKEKFRSSFVMIDRNLMQNHWSENVWEERNQCITTIDFIKQDDIKASLQSSQWDLIVVDEAHKLSAYQYGDSTTKTKRYQAGEVLSDISTHLLFLTATPHRGDENNFRLFLDLLRPGFFAKTDLLVESIQNKENPLFVRRLKEDMKDFKGNKLFPPRNVLTCEFSLSNDEQELYNAVTDYVRNYFNKAKEQRNVTFAMMLLQRRLTSSSDAILLSLRRRKERMDELLELPEKIKAERDEYDRIRRYSEEELEDMEEEERMKIEEKLTNLTIVSNIEDVRREITQLTSLIIKAEKVKEMEIESKLVNLRDKILANLGDNKLLIFTQFTDTLDYLYTKFQNWGYKITKIDGRMRMDERIRAENEFQHESQIMVATEAAGEGINLQFCSWMVNYDIPWNPNRLEQRMGRIHRYGQIKEVFIWNMISQDTIEGRILYRIFEKMQAMQQAMGSDKVFDVIGETLPQTNFERYFKDAVFNQRRIEEIYEQVDQIDRRLVQTTLNKVFLTGLATKHIDYQNLQKKSRDAEEHRLMPEYIEGYFIRAFEYLGGTVEKVRDYWRINSIPYELKKLNEDYNFKTRYGQILNRYSRVTFTKSVSRDNPEYEYIAPGHPLLEAINNEIIQRFSKGERFSVFVDEYQNRHGVLWFVEGEIINGLGEPAAKRMYCLYHSLDGTINQISPSILWDLKPVSPDQCDKACKNLLERSEDIDDHIIGEILFPYKETVEIEVENRCRIKEKYGVRSLEYLISESEGKLLDYQDRQEQGSTMNIAIFNERRRNQNYRIKLETLKKEINLERNLSVSNPKIIGAAVILPAVSESPSEEMHRDPNVEQIGMQVTMKYERENGRNPEDVSKENLGFDVRSTKYNSDGLIDSLRYIEVKARARTGNIFLSSNEWKKAKRFGDNFWLYIITNASTHNPSLNQIQDPASIFKIDENIYATGYNIPLDTWNKNME
jgi:superfamily II DNA or RNA helicase